MPDPRYLAVIGGIHFVYPWGASGNILCFFISGLPGGLDYLMLSAVKAGKFSAYLEKRINCSINTWIRSPGIIVFITLATAAWLDPPPGTPPGSLMPWQLFLPCLVVCFFNAQYYAQRVIGNYYIRKAQDYQKRGIDRVTATGLKPAIPPTHGATPQSSDLTFAPRCKQVDLHAS